MDTNPSPEAQDASPDPAPQLQREIYLQLVHSLMAMLPPPVDPGSDKRAAHARRVNLAAALVSAMLPATAEEADLAVHAVAAGAHASDCLRLAVQQAGAPEIATKLRAQAASMGREARGYRALLLRVQAARQKREADDVAREAAAWTERCVAGLMTQGLDSVRPERTSDEDKDAREDRLRAEADMYAIQYPQRAQLIRRLGGLPKTCDFGPPAPDLVRAIVTGDSQNLRATDQCQADAA